MKKNILNIIALMCFYSLFSQISLSNNASKFLESKIPQEKIYIHFNSSFLLVGENIYYTVYCLNSENNQLSNLSKIAYVELINQNYETIFKHKIKLISGKGQGDFFIPAYLLSGNYKIVAYTQWMRNFGESNIFQSDITVINPFNESQNTILNKTSGSLKINETYAVNEVETTFKENSVQFIDLNLDKKEYKSREKVTMKLSGLMNSKSFGNYSISVREIAPFKILKTEKAVDFIQDKFVLKNDNLSRNFFLPELRGELIFGTVFEKQTKLPAADIKIALTIAGNDKLFKMANSNNLGQFYFNISEYYEQPKALMQIITNPENYILNIGEYPSKKYDDLEFSNFKINEDYNKFILENSIYNQVENAFKEVKFIEFGKVNYELPFYNSVGEVYVLDDYTRFSTLKETIIEVVDAVTLRSKNEQYLLDVIWQKKTYKSGLLPLVIVDGIIVNDHNQLLNYSANKIKKITVVRERYLYGNQLFEGVISFESIKGDFKGFGIDEKEYIVNLNLLRPLDTKNYFNQVYDGSKNLERIPDFRSQLLWLPNLVLDTKYKEITFYTSDNVGDYEISLEGFTNEGIPVSLKEVFSVKN